MKLRHRKMYVELGARIKRARRRRKMSQARLAKILGLSRPSVVNIEQGRQGIAAHQLVDLVSALQTSYGTLLP